MRRAAGAVIAVALATAGLAADPPGEPNDLGLTERATTRLAQIDVTVSGSEKMIRGLTAADFQVMLNGRPVSNVIADDFCTARANEAPVSSPTQAPLSAEPRPDRPRTPATTYLLYFDMGHLTQAGRRASIDAAHEMLPRLLAGGQRAMIVANAAQLKTVVPLTSDETALSAALNAMFADPSTLDTYASLEGKRMADVFDEIASRERVELGLDHVAPLRSRGALETRARSGAARHRPGAFRRSGSAESRSLFRRHDAPEPRAALSLAPFGVSRRRPASRRGIDPARRRDRSNGIDRVINDAAAVGIRFYVIEAQGISGDVAPIEARTSRPRAGKFRRASTRDTIATRRTRSSRWRPRRAARLFSTVSRPSAWRRRF